MHKTLATVVVVALTWLPVGATASPDTEPEREREQSAHRAPATRALAFQPDGNTLSVLRFPSGARSTLHKSRSSIQTVVLSADGNRAAWVYYGGERIRSNRIMVRATDGSGKARNVLARHPRKFDFIDSLDWSPNGRRIAFVGRDGDAIHLWTIKTNGRGLKRIASNVAGCGDNCGSVIWAPDGKSIAWFSELSGPVWRRLWLGSKKVTRLPKGFFGWSDNMRWIGRLPWEDSRIILTRTDGSQRKIISWPRTDDMGGWAPEIYFGADGWIGFRTDEEGDDGEQLDRYVAVNFTTSDVVTLAPADPERGGTFDFR